jgi:hypothetical protein
MAEGSAIAVSKGLHFDDIEGIINLFDRYTKYSRSGLEKSVYQKRTSWKKTQNWEDLPKPIDFNSLPKYEFKLETLFLEKMYDRGTLQWIKIYDENRKIKEFYDFKQKIQKFFLSEQKPTVTFQNDSYEIFEGGMHGSQKFLLRPLGEKGGYMNVEFDGKGKLSNVQGRLEIDSKPCIINDDTLRKTFCSEIKNTYRTLDPKEVNVVEINYDSGEIKIKYLFTYTNQFT